MVTKEEEFAKMRWNIYKVPYGESVFVHFADLREKMKDVMMHLRIPGYTEDQMMRYIIYCYHIHSPLRAKIEDILERKKEALLLAFIDPMDGAYDEVIEDCITYENEGFATAVLHFFKTCEKNWKYAQLVFAQEALYNFSMDTAKSGKSSDFKNRAATMKSLDEAEARVERLTNEVFGGDVKLADNVPLHEIREARLSPEENAAAFE